MFEAVFFDLDGTLVDTAPDLAAALNALRREQGLAPEAPEKLRPHASRGTRGMLEAGLGLTPEDQDYRRAFNRFLHLYRQGLCVDSKLFSGMDEVLARCEARGIKWGVVTNKHARFTLPLLSQLGLRDRCAAIVSGDSTPHPKPAPDPVRLACALAGVSASASLYLGDDPRDILAGNAAGLTTVAVRYGYLGAPAPITEWNATHIIDAPQELLALLG